MALNRDAQAAAYKKLAKARGEAIADARDREAFLKGFAQGPW